MGLDDGHTLFFGGFGVVWIVEKVFEELELCGLQRF